MSTNGPGDLEPGFYTTRERVCAEHHCLVAEAGARYQVVHMLGRSVLLDEGNRLVPMRWWRAIVQNLERAP